MSVELHVNTTVDKLPRGSDFCIFEPGTDVFDDALSGDKVEIVGADGKSVEGEIRRAYTDRFTTLLQGHASSSYSSTGTYNPTMPMMGVAGTDYTRVVRDLQDIHGNDPKLMHVLKSFTVVYVLIPAPAAPLPAA